jgi:hypothetical protein
MPLFLMFIIFDTHSYSTFIDSFAKASVLISSYPYTPSRESNSGLPYSKPANCQLSYAAP